jgi:hypothetical protein
MKNIDLDATHTTPSIKFGENGKLIIKGRSIPSDVSVFYKPLIEWAGELQLNALTVDIDLEYVNSASSKKLLTFMKALDSNNSIRELTVNWHYEKDDEDSFVNGQVFEKLIPKARFNFIADTDIA